ncbi:MAG TPA: L-threonylcarbamoyladenylate synthase [Ferruginibacter sp.]|jgi:L-threonylcarbamoyladenylate synthase|nr:L-threonylcarbamoyladenylate synthase [Ferruginibacter sp.]
MIDFTKDIETCLQVLKTGGLILYPTDTIWGIGCDATNEEAVAKIYQLKKRSDEKSMIVLLAEQRDILHYVAQPDLGVFEFLSEVEKPTTVIYNGAIGLAENLINKNGTIAIRIVEETFCNHLIKRFKKPIVSTSANVSGYPPPQIFSDIDILIKDGVDYVVNYRQDDSVIATPSAIIQWNPDGSYDIIRP